MAGPKEEQLYEIIGQWLDEYNSTSDLFKRKRIKALIATRMLPIIKRIAHTIARRSYDPVEDLVQAGSIGLLKAIDTYSKKVNDNFKIYAGYLIIGEMKHYLRDKLHTIRVPRHIQELAIRIHNFTSSLTLDELNELTNEDVAEALNISQKDVALVMQVDRRKSIISLEEIYAQESDSLGFEEVIAKDDYKEVQDIEDTKIILKEVIEQLPEEYKKLVELYYYDDCNQKEIAERNNLTQMQVSRKMKKAFALLYNMITEQTVEV